MKKYLIILFFAIGFQNLYSKQDSLKYNAWLMPLIFDGIWQRDTLSIIIDTTAIYKLSSVPPNPFQMLDTNEHWKSSDISRYLHRSAKNYVYLNYPHLVKYNLSTLPAVAVEQKAIKANQLRDLFRPDWEPNFNTDGHQKTIPKEVFWWKNGNHTLNLTQNYVSGNWYKGGENNLALLNIQNIKFGYNDKKKLQFETEIECKFSFYSSPQDTIRTFRVIDDASFLKTKLGYKALEKFYYTFSVDFKTQLFNNYKANDTAKTSSFLSPANIYLGLGIDYKLIKKAKNKEINLSVMVMPISYRLIYVRDEDIPGKNFGLDPEAKTKSSYGSKLNANLTWVFNNQVNWVSRLYYFTPYDNTEAEWENIFNFVLNRYISTKLMCHIRYDDKAVPTSGLKHFQMREMFSFGFSYKW